jgi:hypothetical protein
VGQEEESFLLPVENKPVPVKGLMTVPKAPETQVETLVREDLYYNSVRSPVVAR